MWMLGRRGLMSGLLFSGGALAASRALAQSQKADLNAIKKDTDVACVYHCDFGDPARVNQMVTNINNHLSVYENDPFKIKIVVVAHGQGVKPFLKDLDETPWAKEAPPTELFQRFESAAKYGVEVYLCQITFRNLKIDPNKARTDAFIKTVPSGVATLAALQSKGYSYIKVG
jgi:intracellular sulfur oxidation DsrE/DsrF family protein